MKTPLFAIVVIAFACLPGASGSLAFSGEHIVQLQRSYRKNMVTKETFTVANETVSTIEGQPPKTSKESVTIDCKVEVKEVEKGRWRRLAVTVKAVESEPATLTKGTAIVDAPLTVTRKNRIVEFERADGKPLSDAERALLGRFFVPANPTSRDAIFGTDTPKDVKESWDLPGARMAALLKETSGGMFGCDDSDAKGKMTLTRLWKTRDASLLQIDGEVAFKRVKAKGPIADAIDKPEVKATFKVAFHLPTDPALPAFKSEGVFGWKASGTRKGGTGILTVTGQLARSHRIAIIDAGEPNEAPSEKENTE